MNDLVYEEHTTILTDEKKEELDHKREEANVLRDSLDLARFKIELMLGREFTPNTPSSGMLAFFENTNKIGGDGDSLIHFCPGKELGKNDCEHYIPDPSHGYGFLVCPSCKNVWNGDQVIGQIVARLTAEKWAELIYRYYQRLEMRCDIVIKYPRDDIRAAAVDRHVDDALRSARSPEKRLRRIYTMSAIIKDTSAGADLYTRLLAFIRA